ncbi:MAG: hemerythrin domain-containing protein [Gammaproteobacteria bacterium]
MNGNGLPDELPGFDDPLGMLRVCHEKILAHCDLLEGLLESPEAETAARIHRYFSISAPLHHRDEEEDLFPRINRQSLKIAELVHNLKKEHQELHRLWGRLAADLKSLPQDGFNEDFLAAAHEFCRINRAHVTVENMQLLPMAAGILSQQDLGAVGETMAARRGVHYSAL